MSDKKIEKPEADELLRHGKEGSYENADEWYDAVQPHQDDSDMDASWRLKGSDYTQRIAEGTHSEGLARVALNERREDQRMKSVSRKIGGIMDGLTEEEQWEVLKFGDTKRVLEAEGQFPKPLEHPVNKAYNHRDGERELYLELKNKFEPEMTEEEKKELEERKLLAELKRKYDNE